MIEAKVDGIFGGKGYGDVASRLLANNMDTRVLRTNLVLGYDDWKIIDDAVLSLAQKRTGGIQDLISRGLTYNIGNGLGRTVLAYQDVSDINDAELTMDGISKGAQDRQEFDINYLPLPIIHADFSYSTRELNASREGKIPLDTTMAEAATRKVLEKAESVLFTGASSYKFGGGTIYGYQDFTNRNTGSLTANWDASAATGATILADVQAMIQAAINDRHYGPFMLYVPTAYETVLGNDYSAQYGKSVRSRLLELDKLIDIKVSDWLTANNVILVEMQPDTVRIVQGLPIQAVQWESHGGFKVNFKILTILVPQLRADQDDRAGIVHYT